MKLYPFRMPENVHPYAWVLLGFGLPGELLDKLARHLFDDLDRKSTRLNSSHD